MSGGNDGRVIVWDVESRTEIHRHETKPKNDVWAVAFGRDGESVTFGGRDKSVSDWRFDSASPPRILKTMAENVTSLSFSPRGDLLSSATADGVITVWDYRLRVVRYQLIAHSGDAMFCAFSPDGKTLVSGGTEGTIVQFWNVETGEPTISFADDGQHIHAVAFALANTSAPRWDGTARIWKAE